jgi:quercetin dioxygenase-like cupin family protein/DNA-binding XRE family transcriptional regulator
MSTLVKEPRMQRRHRTPSEQAVKAEQAAQTVGSRLRALRAAQQVTLVELAKASGVDAATISRIETGKMSGTLHSHIRLATALGHKITNLYAGIEEERAKDAATVQSPSQSKDVSVYQAGKLSVSMLTTDILRKKLMPVLITIEPGGTTNKEEAKVGTEKFLYMLEGTLEARVGEATHTLKRGSSLYLDASIPHTLRNVGGRSARCLSVITPPVL